MNEQARQPAPESCQEQELHEVKIEKEQMELALLAVELRGNAEMEPALPAVELQGKAETMYLAASFAMVCHNSSRKPPYLNY